MKKILVTGASGFVAGHLVPLFREAFPGVSLVGLCRSGENRHGFDETWPVDLLDAGATRLSLRFASPDAVVHLAAESSVGYSWKEPSGSFLNNCNIYLNLLEALRHEARAVRLLSVGSSEEYGARGAERLGEDLPAQPRSPYAVARAAQTQLNELYVKGFGLDIVSTRSFNHFGPGQTDRFVVSAFCKRFAEMKRGGQREFVAGNLAIERDFTDVRDVVAAYADLLKKGASGRIYNVCSGEGRSLGDLVGALERITGLLVARKVEPAYVRPDDPPRIVGDPTRIRKEIGWSPRFSVEASLQALYEEWLAKLD